MKEKTAPTPQDKIQKQFHLMYFIVKIFAVAFVLFWAVQLVLITVFSSGKVDDFGEKFVGHYYCGTFFIEVSEKDFASPEAFAAYKEYDADQPAVTVSMVIGVAAIVTLCLFMRQADKKRLYSRAGYALLLISAVLLLSASVITEIATIIKQNSVRQYYGGLIASSSYYFQMHVALAMPFVAVCAALLIKSRLTTTVKAAKRNSTLMRVFAGAFCCVGGGFILWRFAVRVYEVVLLLVNGGQNMAVRLPYYSEMLDLPSSAASSSGEYIRLILLRFAKDLPVFVASALCVVLFARLLFDYARGKINTPAHAKYTRIMIIALSVSSVIFNLVGIAEVLLLNSGFIGSYGGAYYTIGIRSNCEPLIYAGLIYIFGLVEKSYPAEAAE